LLPKLFNISSYATLPRSVGALALLSLTMIFSFAGCRFIEKFKEHEPATAVARVHDKYLYEDEIRQMIAPGTTPEDSALMVSNFIQNWIKKQLILYKAETNLDDEKKDVEKKLTEYRNSLITYIYETELIRQQLDTVVSNEEIEKYYTANQRNFELRDNIIKVLYLKIKKDAPKIKKVREWYKSNTAKDRAFLEEYCYQFASDFHLDDETWLLFDELLKKVPIKTFDKATFLRNNRYVELEDSTDLYLVNIKEMKIRESLSPLSFVKDDIRVLIINKRKLDLIKEMEKATYEEALEKNEFEIYR
jgi:hypothetical protein